MNTADVLKENSTDDSSEDYRYTTDVFDKELRAIETKDKNTSEKKKERKVYKNKVWEREYDIGRNDKCPCGSGKKYKKCCLDSGKYERYKEAKQ